MISMSKGKDIVLDVDSSGSFLVTDGKRMYQIRVDLKEAFENNCKNVVKEFEKQIMLHIIDDCWKENLRALDELKHSVQNASYEQKDPLVIFKVESVNLFDCMVNEMNDRIVSILMRAAIPEMQQQDIPQQEAPEPAKPKRPQYVEQKVDLDEAQRIQRAVANRDTRESAQQQPRIPIIREPKVGRNDPCPCGSGKKYKQCHGRNI